MERISPDSFKNTEMAFAAKSNHQLKKAHLIFRLVSNNVMAGFATSLASIGLSLRLPIKGLIKHTVFEHFCGGEDISDCHATTDLLAKYRVGSILDYSVEGKNTEEAFDHTMAETIKTIEHAKGNKDIPFCVFKPTGIGSAMLMEKVENAEELSDDELSSFERMRERYHTLANKAHDCNVRLLIDAEDSWYQATIDNIVYDLMKKYNAERAIVFNTYQMYLNRSLNKLKLAHGQARSSGFVLGAKLVRGAYMENERERASMEGYEDPICANKEATDKSYNDALQYCVSHIGEIELFSGTHNEFSNYYLTSLMEAAGLEKGDKRVYFAQLYGMSDNISFVLANAGYNVAKYVPYGPVQHVMPYLVRRAKENTSVGGQSSRELTLIRQELYRRKNHRA